MGRRVLPILLALGWGCGTVARRAEAPPNFVAFIADDLGEGDLGCYGHAVLRTPHIDRLAREGMRFERAFLTISSCSPSRASILTGRYPHNTGAEDLHQPLPADQWTVARHLRPAGYHCAAAGKWHLGGAEKARWDRIVECPGRETAAGALRLLADRPRDRPFFLWVASLDPHRPYDETGFPDPHDPARAVVPPYLPDHPLIRKEIAQYYDEIERLDRHVGEVVAELERQGALDRTFVVFMSDNGMPFPRAKTTLYDSGIRTPFIVRYPPLVRAGSVQRGLASAVDLAPTILDLARVPQRAMQGRSLRPMLEDPAAPGRDAVYAEANWHDYDQFTRAVRTGRYLLVRNYYWDKPLWNSVDSINSATWKGYMEMGRAGRLTPAQRFLFAQPRPFEEFYDLDADPHSLRNLAEDPSYGERRVLLRALLDNWRVDTADAMPAERRPEGWTREGVPLPHNQPWYDEWKKQGRSSFETFK